MGKLFNMNSIDFSKRIRISVLKMINNGNSSHIGSALGVADIISVLFRKVLKLDSENPKDASRSRFILSKGHSGAVVYAAMAELGFFEREKLMTHYQNGSTFSGHISHVNNPGIELSTGSLGHGLSVSSGMALALKMLGNSARVYCVLSDGECDEGSVWEAAMFASHHKLENLIAIVDYNKLQSLTTNEDTLKLEPFDAKWKSFGWTCVRVDGHDHDALYDAFVNAGKDSKPTVFLADTIKGKGVSFMENSVLWHYRTPKGEEFSLALSELENS